MITVLIVLAKLALVAISCVALLAGLFASFMGGWIAAEKKTEAEGRLLAFAVFCNIVAILVAFIAGAI